MSFYKRRTAMKTLWILFMVFCAAALSLPGCDDGGGEKDETTDQDAEDIRQDDVRVDDVPSDRDVQQDDVVVDDVVQDDVPEDEGDVQEDADVPPPPPCEAPAEPAIGTECESATDCDADLPRCFTEETVEFNGEEYVSWPGGTCAIEGTGTLVCDIDDPVATCPEGMKCVFFYDFGSSSVYGCLDACNSDVPDTDPPELYDFNCGCREGYYCDMGSGICQPGCSHDRECCELWIDANDDYVRDAGEVEVLSACTNVCDNDPTVDGGASYQCVNNGTAGATFSSPCEHNSQCPVNGRCLDPYWYTDDDGEPYFPGGYCLRDRCDAVGRGCSAEGGNCGNLGTADEPFWACVTACHLGDDPDGASFPCRKTPAGEKMTCLPIFTDEPFLDTTDFDGYCWYGNFTTVTAPDYTTECTDPAQCFSPLGLGNCYTLADVDVSFCSSICTEDLAVNHAVCGSAAEGVCWASMTGMCWPACDTPGGALGANGCAVTDPPAWACYATADFSDDMFVATGATMPAGLCFPACTSDTDCTDLFGTAMTCNTSTGVCG
jgi:hypothetical protein